MFCSEVMACICRCAPNRHRSESAGSNVVQNHGQLFCVVTNKCTIISQIITLLHVLTLSCRPQGACNQYLARLHKYLKFNVCHPEVFNTYINIQWCISQTQQNFIVFIIVLGQHVSVLIESPSGPAKNTDPYLAIFNPIAHFKHC